MSIRIPPAALRPGIRVLRQRVFDPTTTWNRQRHLLNGYAVTVRPRRGTRSQQIQYGTVVTTQLTSATSDSARVVLHFHGGGYTTGSPKICRAWASGLAAEAGVTVVLVDYRLAPEHPAPAAADDARAAWTALTASIAPGSVVLSGDSAGAGLALGLAQSLAAAGEPGPAGLLLLSPWLDLSADRTSPADLVARDILLSPAWLEACVTAYAGTTEPSAQELSPLFGPLADLPPTLVQAGADDILITDADRFVTRARAAGTTVTYARAPGMWHDFPLQAGVIAAADRAVTQAANFVTDLLT